MNPTHPFYPILIHNTSYAKKKYLKGVLRSPRGSQKPNKILMICKNLLN